MVAYPFVLDRSDSHPLTPVQSSKDDSRRDALNIIAYLSMTTCSACQAGIRSHLSASGCTLTCTLIDRKVPNTGENLAQLGRFADAP